jgi:hypothetical protein
VLILPKVVNSIEELLMAVKKDVFESLDDIKNEYTHDNDNPKYVMMQKVDETVYSGTNKWYDNSYELRDSIEATNATDLGDSVEISLYHNHDILQYDPEAWKHGSKNRDIRDILPEILNNERPWGVIEGLFNSDAAFRNKDRAYVDETVKELKDGRLKKWLLSKLVTAGYRGV